MWNIAGIILALGYDDDYALICTALRRDRVRTLSEGKREKKRKEREGENGVIKRRKKIIERA